MDKMILKAMQFYGYHGVLNEEQKLGQRFVVDLELGLSLREAGLSDDLEATVNYAEICDHVKRIVEGSPFRLIEALAEYIASSLLESYTKIINVTVRVLKPNPPVSVHFAGAVVEIERTRHRMDENDVGFR